MASTSKIHLTAQQKPENYVPGLTPESAKKASELLQENHDKHHIFFNQDGFHNHIAHHILTIFALNATPTELQTGYDNNVYYQRPTGPVKRSIVEGMHDPESFKKYLGKEKYYHDFLTFFKDEIDKKGWEAVLNEYLFKGDERADDMLVRLFSGFLHPIIHLGFGIEFQQPAIIAEGLAQAAIHSNWMAPLFLESEKAAQAKGSESGPQKTIVQLLDEIRADKKLSSAAHWSDGNKIRDGILKRAPQEMIQFASQYRLTSPDQLPEKTAEMINAAAYFTGTSQRPPKQIKFDFYYMHCVTNSIFFSTFLSTPSLSPHTRTRLLEWKVRNDMAMYASRHSPALLHGEITKYGGSRGSWDEVVARTNRVEDDGHTSKFVRALRHGEVVCREWEERGSEGFLLRGEDWRVLANMVLDSVVEEPRWVRSCGFEEAWEGVGEREGARL